MSDDLQAKLKSPHILIQVPSGETPLPFIGVLTCFGYARGLDRSFAEKVAYLLSWGGAVAEGTPLDEAEIPHAGHIPLFDWGFRFVDLDEQDFYFWPADLLVAAIPRRGGAEVVCSDQRRIHWSVKRPSNYAPVVSIAFPPEQAPPYEVSRTFSANGSVNPSFVTMTAMVYHPGVPGISNGVPVTGPPYWVFQFNLPPVWPITDPQNNKYVLTLSVQAADAGGYTGGQTRYIRLK